jgi:hypothetical protein
MLRLLLPETLALEVEKAAGKAVSRLLPHLYFRWQRPASRSLQGMAEPRAEHVLAEKFDDEADDDPNGDPEHPEKHLHRQLRRIRRGEKVERLTVLRR